MFHYRVMASDLQNVLSKLGDQIIAALRDPVLVEAGLIVEDQLEIDPWKTDSGSTIGWSTQVAAIEARDTRLELFLDSYLSYEDKYLLSCWAHVDSSSYAETVANQLQDGRHKTIHLYDKHRDDVTNQLESRKADEIQSNWGTPVIDHWPRQHFVGFFLPAGAVSRDEAVGEAIRVFRRLANILLNLAGSEGLDEVDEERRRSVVASWLRPGQARFRADLMRDFGGRCVISGCDVPVALEAAHIQAVALGGSDEPANGLLLRADLHLLYDLGLLKLNTVTDGAQVVLHPSISESAYSGLNHRVIRDKALVRRHGALKQR